MSEHIPNDENNETQEVHIDPTVSREFMLFTLAGTIVVGTFILLALQIEVPTWLILIVSNVASVFFGVRIERLR